MKRKRSAKSTTKRLETTSDVTYQSRLWVLDDAEPFLLEEMERWGRAKVGDFKIAQDSYNDTGVTVSRGVRSFYLLDKCFTYREARAIIEANDDVIHSAVKVRKQHRKTWLKELEAAPSRVKHKYSRRLERSERLHVCLGGVALFRRAQRDPRAMSEWRERRLFLSMGGEADRPYGNANIRLIPRENHSGDNQNTTTFDVWVRLRGKMTLVGETTLKRGAKQVLGAQAAGRPVSAQFLVRDGVYKIHVTPAVPIEVPPPGLVGNTVGFDLNSKHFEATVVDDRGNPLWSKSYPFDAAREIGSLVRAVEAELRARDVVRVGAEALGGMTRSRSSKVLGHKSPAVRSAVNKIPTAVFGEALTRLCRRLDAYSVFVNPSGTSKLVTEWPEEHFGADTHHKSSYLVARRAMGLPIKRSRYGSSARRRMSTPGQGTIMGDPLSSNDGGLLGERSGDAGTNLLV